MLTLSQIYRRLVDASIRREHSVAITHSGGKRTVISCVCGASDTESSDWGKRVHHTHGPALRTKHARGFCADHAGCMARIVAKHAPGTMAALVDVAG